jgi:16S rRNA (cytosine967-C5)-methyltransferase
VADFPGAPAPPGRAVSARAAAVTLLFEVLEESRTLDAAMAHSVNFAALEPRDRAFARAIASASLRRKGRLEAVLAAFLEKPLPEDAPHARALLLSAAAQLLAMGSAAHAVVHETVALAQSDRRTRGFAKLMNAVLRRVAEQGPERFAALAPQADLPDWLVARWRAAHGAETAARIAAALGGEPALDLTCREDAADWAQRLGGALVLAHTVRLKEHPPVQDLEGFDAGAWWVQDAAAALPARLLAPPAGARVLDACAAPGGKTLQLAAMGCAVTALDKTEARLRRLRENLDRTGLQAELLCADAGAWRSPAPFDAVLLDAPCSATGTLRRHPEAAWLRTPEQLRRYTAEQARLFAACAALTAPGGRLVYAVCSLEPEEGEGVVAAAESLGLARDPIGADELPGLESAVTPQGFARTFPFDLSEAGGLDGFFIARFRKG